MLAEGALPCDTVAPPSFTATYQLPPLSPLRLNWMVAFMPLAASAFTLADICSKISFGVILETPPIGVGVLGNPGFVGQRSRLVKNRTSPRYLAMDGSRPRGPLFPHPPLLRSCSCAAITA